MCIMQQPKLEAMACYEHKNFNSFIVMAYSVAGGKALL